MTWVILGLGIALTIAVVVGLLSQPRCGACGARSHLEPPHRYCPNCGCDLDLLSGRPLDRFERRARRNE